MKSFVSWKCLCLLLHPKCQKSQYLLMETYWKHRGDMTALHTQQIVHSQIYGGKKLGDMAQYSSSYTTISILSSFMQG